jgi:hypothetical protein
MTKAQLGYNILLFLISPLLAVLPALASFGKRYTKTIIIIFFGFYGATMIFPPGTDGTRHAGNIENHYEGLELGEFLKETKAIFLFRPEPETNDDFFLHLISYIVSFFSSTTTGLYLVIGLIYGYFFTTGVSKVYSSIEGKWTFVVLLLFIVFVSWKSFEGINSIRNHTGAWIFFNGAFSYFKTRERKYILLVMLAPIVHFGYFIITLPFYVVLFLGNRPYLYLSILCASFFVKPNVTFIENLTAETELGRSKFDGYVRDETYFQRKEEARLSRQSFHVAYYMTGIRYVLVTLLFFAIFFSGYLHKKKQYPYLLSCLASMAILLLAASNMSSFAESLEKRLFSNFGYYALSYLTILFSISQIRQSKQFFHLGAKLITVLSIPPIGLFLFVQYSLIGEFTDFRVVVSPILYPLFSGESVSIKEFIKQLMF